MNTNPQENEANTQLRVHPLTQPVAMLRHPPSARGDTPALLGLTLSLLCPLLFIFSFELSYSYNTQTTSPFWIAICFCVTPLCSLLGLIFSARGGFSSAYRFLAIVGLVLSLLELLGYFLVFVVFFTALSGG